MTVPILTFFNNKGGVGKTSLIYHLAWMYSELEHRVLAVDLDPQANLTAAFLPEDDIEAIWESKDPGGTIYRCVEPLSDVGDLKEPELVPLNMDLLLLPGDVGLSSFEDTLSQEWPKALNSKKTYRSMRVLSAFWQVMQMAAKREAVDIILVDIGPNLGAINRAALIATDYVVIPLGADLFSLQGLKNLGPTLRDWRKDWKKRIENWQDSPDGARYTDFHLPNGSMLPIGYMCQQHGVRLNRPIKAYDKWVNRIPTVYREHVLNEPAVADIRPATDRYCLATLKHYRSLIPMGQEQRKPIFHLTAADGAIGSHANAVQDARQDFKILAETIWAEMTKNPRVGLA